MVNWSLTVSDDIDQSVRQFPAEQDGEERDMAAFVEKAVRRDLLHLGEVEGIPIITARQALEKLEKDYLNTVNSSSNS